LISEKYVLTIHANPPLVQKRSELIKERVQPKTQAQSKEPFDIKENHTMKHETQFSCWSHTLISGPSLVSYTHLSLNFSENKIFLFL